MVSLCTVSPSWKALAEHGIGLILISSWASLSAFQCKICSSLFSSRLSAGMPSYCWQLCASRAVSCCCNEGLALWRPCTTQDAVAWGALLDGNFFPVLHISAGL